MNIFPALRYKDASAAIDLLGSYDGGGWLGGRPMEPLASSISVYVVVGDPDAHYARAKKAGATIVREITDEDYGSREYSARDLEGNLWSFGTYDPNDT
jgi:uncharacterized glyoxalase superfamily protein PhnB